jgi:hypothetical protein
MIRALLKRFTSLFVRRLPLKRPRASLQTHGRQTQLRFTLNVQLSYTAIDVSTVLLVLLMELLRIHHLLLLRQPQHVVALAFNGDLLINLGFMLFLFSGGVWRTTVMLTLAILIYLYALVYWCCSHPANLTFVGQVTNWCSQSAISIQLAKSQCKQQCSCCSRWCSCRCSGSSSGSSSSSTCAAQHCE